MRRLGSIVVVLLLASCDAARPITATPTEIRAAHSYDPAKDRGTRRAEIRPPDVPTARALYCPEPPAGSADKMPVELWFTYYAPEGNPFLDSIVVVDRYIRPTDAVISAALREWIEGPTKLERKLGVVGGPPPDAEVLGIDIDDGIVTVDMNQAFMDNGLGTVYEGWMLTEFAGTVTQFPGIERVFLRIEGETVPYFGGHGFIIEDGFTRPSRRWAPDLEKFCLVS